MSGPQRDIGRRAFLRESAAAAALCTGRGALPIFLAACAGAQYIRPSRIGAQLAIPLDQLMKKGSALIEPQDGQLPIYIRATGAGEFAAVLTRCMHRGCQVEPSSDRFVCPCHGSEYTFEGAVLKGPTEKPLVRYRVTADDSRVYIHLDSVIS